MTTEKQPQVSAIQEEANFLKYLRDNFTTNAKDLQQLARAAASSQPLVIQQGIINSILRSRDPVGYVRECFEQANDYPIIIETFIESGDHGMIVVDGKVHGVKIDARWEHWLKEEDRWNVDQEIEIMHQLVEAWMVANKVNVFKAKILLFPFFGFTGYFRRINKHRIFGKFI